MRERVCQFGPHRQLVGITTELTEGTDRLPDAPAVVLLNSGLLHHVGQHRFNVRLARRLAQIGCHALRFDFSGLGDSSKRQSSASVVERSVEDTRFALDFLERRRKIRRFVVVGLCSGADIAHRTAVVDDRICGTVVIESYAYPTTQYFLRRYARRALSVDVWARFLAQTLGLVAHQTDTMSALERDFGFFWELPYKVRLEAELRTLISRGVARLAVFSGNNRNYAYEAQFADSFPKIDFRDLLDVAYFRQADHGYAIEADRQALVSRIVEWFGRRFRTDSAAGHVRRPHPICGDREALATPSATVSEAGRPC